MPFFVCIVAPVIISTSGASGSSSHVNRFSNTANDAVASIMANMSPAHRRCPPPNGTYAKSVDCSFGYSPVYKLGSYPFHPLMFGFSNRRCHRDGSNASGFSQYSGLR